MTTNDLTIDCIIAIDPGANGGIAVYSQGQVESVKMPKEVTDVVEYINYWKSIRKPIVFLEKLNIRPDDVSVSNDGQSNMGKLYRIQKMIANFEGLKAAIQFSGVPFVLVHPMKWQSGLKMRIKGEEKAERKKRYKEVAQSLYKSQKATMWNCDALLIMHFARKVLVNDLQWVLSQLPSNEQKKLF